ncbi:MAG: inositol monophosphatase [Lentisphaeria bacterium]|nr:inositol monophosphatase [Lentisphaeria bacterium]
MIDFITDLARTAGEEAMRHFGNLKPGEVVLKNSVRDLVSVADKAVEKLIVEAIRKRFPDHGIFGEETGRSGSASDFCWVIDPIDGTQNFVKNIPIFAVSIGLEKKGVPVAGCVNLPALGLSFCAEQGKGAFENGRPIHVSDCTELDHALCATGFACLRAGLERNNLPYFSRIAPQLRGVLRTGSAACDLCFVASGRLDGFWEFALQEYDIAAGVVIAREAGAVVTDHHNGDAFPAKGFLCAPPALHEKLLAYLDV